MDFIRRVLDRVRRAKRVEAEFASDNLDISQREHLLKEIRIAANLEKNITLVREAFGHSQDLEVHRFEAGSEKVPAAALFIDGMVSTADVTALLRNVQADLLLTGVEPAGRGAIYETVRRRLITVAEINEETGLEGLLVAVTRGDTVLFFDGTARALVCSTRGFVGRSPMEPDAETSIRGPRDGFVENIRTNTSLLRRRLHTPNLWIENIEVGTLTRTPLALAYIKGLADENVVGEVRSRLQGIQLDGVLESGYLEDFLQDNPWTPFPLVLRTERPDRTAGALLEGRVAVLTDGTPFALVVPTQFSMMIQGADDYYEQFPISTFLRALRYLAFLISLLLPGSYVAVINFHLELLPTVLILRIAASKEGVPFPILIEALFIEAMFEVLREAGVRLPRAIGPAISIVGALILGDAAIRSGLVSPPIVIVVALTAIASFTAPTFSLGIAARLTRFAFILLGGAFGLFGIQFGILLLLVHLCALRSFGVPYMYPFGPLVLADMRDNILRLPWWKQTGRPRLVGRREPGRQQPGPRPGRRSGPGGERKD